MADIQKPERFRSLRSLTRLLVGGILLGTELLEDQLRVWEGKDVLDDQVDQDPAVDDPLPETLPDPQFVPDSRGKTGELRYALIGLIFEGEEKLEEALNAAGRLGSRADRVLDPITRPIKKIGNSRPVQGQIERLTNRGQRTVSRWIERGQDEEVHSRQLTQQAATSTVDQSILYMAENEAITKLIQSQSVGIAEQILELVRAISVSADYFAEGVVRYLFRMRPRYLLPPPNREVREQATRMLQEIWHEEN